MIDRNSKEWELWKDAYNIKSELSPPPEYSQSGDYWRKALDKVNEGYTKYKGSETEVLAEHIFLGIILQLERESQDLERVQGIIKGVADKLTI